MYSNLSLNFKYRWAFICSPLLFAFQKLIFNSDGDHLGAININLILIFNAVSSFFVILLTFVIRAKKISIHKDFFSISWISYFSLGLFSVFFSINKAITIYWSLFGIALYFFGLHIYEQIIKHSYDILSAYLIFRKILLHFVLFSILINALFVAFYFSPFDLLKGIPGDYLAMLLVLLYLSDFLIFGGSERFLKLFFIFLLSFFLNSFSSVVSLFLGISFYIFTRVSKLLFLIIFIIACVAILFGIEFLNESIGEAGLFNKSYEAYLTGSGRFDMYFSAFNAYVFDYNIFNKIFGVGFMAEREILLNYDLPWVTDPHNSLILSGLGLGAVGMILFIFFICYPFWLLRKYKSTSKYLFLIFHVSFVSFGMTASYYMGRPSFLLLFSFILYKIFSHYSFNNFEK